MAAQKHVDARVQQGVGRGAAFAAVPAAAIVALAEALKRGAITAPVEANLHLRPGLA